MNQIAADPLRLSLAFFAALLAGAINSVAGGGTLLSFPVLVALGFPTIPANATSTLGIWPGTLGSLWGFRREIARTSRTNLLLALPCLVGGALGALLLRSTERGTFDHLVPFLVLFATILFAVRGRIQAWLERRRGEGQKRTITRALASVMLVLLVGVYGGFFGAGMSIMNLSILGLLGMTELLEMNALTSLFSLCVNGVAVVVFVAAGLCDLRYALAMGLGAIVGGYGAVGIARRVGKKALGRFVVVVGFVVSAVFLVRSFG